jgi:peptidoglycan/LPS O-acetylase OafA/YrhL
VLGAHCTVTDRFPQRLTTAFTWLFDGPLGVRFFFVISGFLITWLLLLEVQKNGAINLKNFYIRRALRILPVYFAFLAVLFGLQLFTVFHIDRHSWIGSLTFTTNLVGSSSWTNGHLWSLAQEEQFYLIWPTLFALSGAFTSIRKAAYILGLPILFCPLFRVLAYLNMVPLLFSRGMASWDTIAIGCAAALLFHHKRQSIEKYLVSMWRPVGYLAAALILVPYSLTKLFIFGIFTVPLGETFQALGFSTVLVMGILSPNLAFFRFLGRRWMCEVGVLSYSIYIWQQIFCTKPKAFGLVHAWWLSFPEWVAAALVVAFISFYAFERPLFALRRHFRA